MTYTLSVATQEGRDLVVEALRQAARQRTTVARKAAVKVAEDKRAGTRDVRPASVKVTALLAEAGTLEELADELATATDVAIVTVDAAGRLEVPAPRDAEAVVAEQERITGLDRQTIAALHPAADDGTSVAAQLAAERAGLKPYDPDEPEDPLTGATSEDDPVEVEEVLG